MVPLMLLATAALAALVPARKAMRIDPLAALANRLRWAVLNSPPLTASSFSSLIHQAVEL